MNLSARFSNTKHVKQAIASAITCGMLLILPSCAIPPLRPAQPGPGLPESFNGTTNPDNSAQLGIHEFYSDPMLTRLIDQALVSNRELRILDEEVQIAANEVLARRGAYLPFLSFGAGLGLDKRSGFTPLGAAEEELEYRPDKHFPKPVPNYRFGVNFFWHPDIWRELRNARDAAVQRHFAAIERRNDFVTRLVAEIAETYYELMALDKRLENLDRIIDLQQRSLDIARARKGAARETELAVQRFQAEVRKNQSEKLIVKQEIIEAENRINFRAYRFPQPVERASGDFIDLQIHSLCVGVPAQLLLNRPDIRRAERELVAAGLDIKVARAHFFPSLDITAHVGYETLNPKYLLDPEALFYDAAGDLVAPLINRKAIRADYLTANARQLQSVYDYQGVILNAVTEVVNRLSKVENYRKSIEVKKQQLESLESAVNAANKLFQAARAEYVDVLFSQRDLFEARRNLIVTKQQQLSAVVNTYQALGGGSPPPAGCASAPGALLAGAAPGGPPTAPPASAATP